MMFVEECRVGWLWSQSHAWLASLLKCGLAVRSRVSGQNEVMLCFPNQSISAPLVHRSGLVSYFSGPLCDWLWCLGFGLGATDGARPALPRIVVVCQIRTSADCCGYCLLEIIVLGVLEAGFRANYRSTFNSTLVRSLQLEKYCVRGDAVASPLFRLIQNGSVIVVHAWSNTHLNCSGKD